MEQSSSDYEGSEPEPYDEPRAFDHEYPHKPASLASLTTDNTRPVHPYPEKNHGKERSFSFA